MKWRKPTCALLVAMLILGMAMISVTEVTYATILDVTVATDKPNYYLGENVTIHGNLTLDGSPCEGLVALEVDDLDRSIVIRTLQTGAPPPPGNVTIVDVYPCDEGGTPKESFTRGEIAYFRVSVRNNGATPLSLTITSNVYDKDNVPIVAGGIQMPLAQGYTGYVIMPTLIPEWAALGNGTAYANVFTDYPRVGGIPYCLEKSTTFNITDGSQGGGTSQTPSPQNFGNYSLTFRLPRFNARCGNYTVYATSSYQLQQAINSTTFKAKLLGDINGNNFVGSDDIIIIQKKENYGVTPSSAAMNPEADINGNNFIGSDDIIIVQKKENYGGTCT